ncbi:MAG TPA: hypothetical protein VGN97_21345 [Mesorhizobium sp.]|jgi:hypothetical protein|nr:hypothetical protein [Mesorhizobium sp.]
MSVAAIGAFVGLVLALAELVFLRALAGRVDLPETRRVLHVVGATQIVLFPVLGWFLAPLAFGD